MRKFSHSFTCSGLTPLFFVWGIAAAIEKVWIGLAICIIVIALDLRIRRASPTQQNTDTSAGGQS